MTHVSHNPKKLLVASGALFAALILPMAASYVTGVDYGFIPTAQAAEGGHSGASQGQKGKPDGAGSGAQGGGAHSGGGAMGKKVFRTPVSAEEEDSDRPAWAGVKGGKAGGGGKPAGAGSKKGDLFGDMVVILRDSNGEPILSGGYVQVIAYYYPEGSTTLVPLKDADGNLVVIPRDEEGDLLPTVTVGGVTYTVFGAEAELGRLSVGRAPTKVLDHALSEALAKLTAAGAVVTLDATGRLVVNGVTIDSPLENLALYDAYMSGTLTVALPAGFNPASLLAAAADKTGTVGIDTVIYMNSILGINNLAADPDVYYNFDTYNYDRETTWKNVTVQVLADLDGDGTYKVETVNVYDVVFGGTDWVDPTPVTGDAGADDFAAAANDYLQVIEFVHDNEVR